MKFSEDEEIMNKEIQELVNDADLVLVGLGREFEKERLKQEKEALQAVNKLAEILDKKNYYVVSVCTNDIAASSVLKGDRVVQPCGTIRQKQCPNRCEEGLLPLEEEEMGALEQKLNEPVILPRAAADVQIPREILEALQQTQAADLGELELGSCPKCGGKLVLNTVDTPNYDENGYLKDWNRYTKWLQGTINKKLCILELGVDLSYPSIIRWPFEKVAFYNQKSHFVRVNEKLYHMSEEIKDKGVSVPMNAVQWLLEV